MKFGVFFVFLMLFMFSFLLFPLMQDAIIASALTGPFALLISVFPYIFLSIIVVCLVYFIKEKM